MSCSSFSKFLKVFLRVVLFLGVIFFFFVSAAHENGGRRMMKIIGVKSRATGNMKNHDRMAVMRTGRSEKHRASSKFHMIYMSKRRVPNGPDPIHNRRAGNSRQPPGQA